jgi:hypothetical protein
MREKVTRLQLVVLHMFIRRTMPAVGATLRNHVVDSKAIAVLGGEVARAEIDFRYPLQRNLERRSDFVPGLLAGRGPGPGHHPDCASCSPRFFP